MVGPMYDCLANPLGAVRLTFEKAVGSVSNPSAFDGKDWGAVDLFRDSLSEQDALSRVPILNPSTVKWVQQNTLVRYRGMIQDMLGNEFYVGAYKDGSSWKTNKFTDISLCPVESSRDMRIWERRLLYCVPPPCQNSWVEPCCETLQSKSMDGSSENREKRRRMDPEDDNDMDMVTENELDSVTARKRMFPFEVMYQDICDTVADDLHIASLLDFLSVGESALAENPHEPSTARVPHSPNGSRMLLVLLNGPYPETRRASLASHREDGQTCTQDLKDCTSDCNSASMTTLQSSDSDPLPCLVKIYDSLESDLKLNEIFEFVGIVTFDSETEVTVEKNDHDGFSDEALTRMPPSKVPRLHCIMYRKLVAHDFLSSSPVIEPNPHLLKETRESLLRHLTSVLGNDGIAAQFMLLHLLSKVHNRADDFAVGKLSVNLTGCSKETVSIFGRQLSEAVKNLLPFTQWIPLTLEYLNSVLLGPKKDYTVNRLMPGVLQMPEGSHLIIDETQLQAGVLDSTGVGNARLLKVLAEIQKVEYDFEYYKMDMAADVSMLVLSEGKSNIVPADVVVPFQPSLVCFSEGVSDEAIKLWRWYVATVRSLPHSYGEEIQKVLEDDLVAAKLADRSLSGGDFSRLLTMGRLIASSFGETCLSLEHWQMVKELERLRRERFK